MRMRPIEAWLLAAGLIAAAPAPAAVTWVAIARDGQASPDGNGTFGGYTRYGEAFLNDSGQVVFAARRIGTAAGTADDAVIARGNGLSVALIAREGQPIPDGPGAFGHMLEILRQYSINDSGRIAFNAPLTGTPGGTSDDRAIYSAVDPGVYWKVVRKGEIAPFTTSPFNALLPPQINEQPPSAVAFYASLGAGFIPGVAYVWRLGVLHPVAYGTQLAPDQGEGDGVNGSITSFPDNSASPPSLRSNASEVALWAHLAGTTSGSLDDDGIFRASPDGIVDLARGNRPAPGGGTYAEFNSPVYNADGIAAFRCQLQPSGPGPFIIALDWPFGGDLAVTTGSAAADGNGVIANIGHPSLNIAEAVSYRVTFSGTAGGGLDDTGIYLSDVARLTLPNLENLLAREGQPPPEGDGVFNDFGNLTAINDSTQVLFTATLRSTDGGASDDRGLYLWDKGQGLVKLLREGDLLGGRTVVAFSTLTERDHGGTRTLNDRGEACVRVDLSPEGGDGVYRIGLERPTVGVETGPASNPGLVLGPNPVRDRALIRFTRPPGAFRLTVVDLAGRTVKVLADQHGDSELLRWDVRDTHGRTLPAGIYFLRLETALGVSATRFARLP